MQAQKPDTTQTKQALKHDVQTKAQAPAKPAAPAKPTTPAKPAAPFQSEAASTLSRTAKRFFSSVKRGYNASISLYSATKKQQEHEQKTAELASELASAKELFEHRTNIAANYDTHMKQLTLAREQEQTTIHITDEELVQTRAQAEKLESAYRTLTSENAKKLAPYKELMDVAKAHSDELSVKLAEAKRGRKLAENACDAAKKRRDREIEDAHHACDHARERLAHIQLSLSNLQNDRSASQESLHKMQSELAACRAHADRAFEDVDSVTRKHEELIRNAQDELVLQKSEVDACEKEAETARTKANSERENYEALFKSCKQEEQKLQDSIHAQKTTIAELQAQNTQAHEQLQHTTMLIDEAVEIHEHPELTKHLELKIQQQTKQLAARRAMDNQLSLRRNELARASRRERFLVLGLVICAVVLLVILVLIMLNLL